MQEPEKNNETTTTKEKNNETLPISPIKISKPENSM